MRVLLFLAALAICLPGKGNAAIVPTPDLSVHASHDGETVHIMVDMHVPVLPKRAWEVMTDFDHMAEFVPNLQSSKVLNRNGNHLKVQQKGSYNIALWNFPFESVREVDLFPITKVVSHSTGGTVKSMESTTRLEPDGQNTRIQYSATLVSGFPLPPLIGSTLLGNEVRDQFQAMRDEMIKRDQHAAHPAQRSLAHRKRTLHRA